MLSPHFSEQYTELYSTCLTSAKLEIWSCLTFAKDTWLEFFLVWRLQTIIVWHLQTPKNLTYAAPPFVRRGFKMHILAFSEQGKSATAIRWNKSLFANIHECAIRF